MSVTLVDATYPLLTAAGDARRLGAALGAEIAEGWLDFPEALPATAASYAGDPGPKRWGTIFFMLNDPTTLVGWGGYKGAPDADGVVELGYAIAPSFRGRGLATEATGAMIARAFADAGVAAVAAHTLAEENASTAVLRKCGFSRVAEIIDPDDGPIWRWRLARF